MNHLATRALVISTSAVFLAACATAPKSSSGKEDLQQSSATAMKELKAEDPSLEEFLNKAYGYAVFPKVGKAAWGVGGSYGRGVVHEQGDFIGYADITQASIGLQAGGQTFTQLLVFESQADLERFKSGRLSLAGNLSAVILKTGAAESARYSDGVAVFVKPIGGAMVEASVGGQQFKFQPK